MSAKGQERTLFNAICKNRNSSTLSVGREHSFIACFGWGRERLLWDQQRLPGNIG